MRAYIYVLLAVILVVVTLAARDASQGVSDTLLASSKLLDSPPGADRRCLGALARDGEPLWLAVYGDSLARGVFFDTVALFNSTGQQFDGSALHPGHSANYSRDCTLVEARPPSGRKKCGGFAFDSVRASAARANAVHPMALVNPNDASPPSGAASIAARLSFRLKTFMWEPAFDRPWLEALRRARRLPDVLLLSAGIWDMQYPPTDDPGRGAAAFVDSLRRFLAALDEAVDEAVGRRGSGGGDADGGALSSRLRARRPRIYWLTVTAVADEKLPLWKRSRMSVARSREYNERALPELRRSGIVPIDTFASGAAHPELSVDGVHFPGPLSHYHAKLTWHTMCADERRWRRSRRRRLN